MRDQKSDKSRIVGLYPEKLLTKPEVKVLKHILLNGSSTVYEISKFYEKNGRENIPQSTAHKAMKTLGEKGLVQLHSEEIGDNKQSKKFFELTLNGFCYAIYIISIQHDTTYDILRNAIKRWEKFCPEILGHWGVLTAEKQSKCKFTEEFTKILEEDDNFFVPYSVPTLEAKFWIHFLRDLCYQILRFTKKSENEDEKDSIIFINDLSFMQHFIIYLEYIIYGNRELKDFLDIDYFQCVIQSIPIVWERYCESVLRRRDYLLSEYERLNALIQTWPDPSGGGEKTA